MISVTLSVSLNEWDLRALWQKEAIREGHDTSKTPVGQILADWYGAYLAYLIESHHVDAVPAITDICALSDTANLLGGIIDCGNRLGNANCDLPDVNEAKERRATLKELLGLPDSPEASEDALEELLKAYGTLGG